MWWRDDGDGEEVSAALDRLDETGPHPGLLGYGMAYHRGRRVPLLIVHEKHDPRPQMWASGEGWAWRLLRAVVAGRDVPVPPWVEPDFAWSEEDVRVQIRPAGLADAIRLLVQARLLARLTRRGGLLERGIAVELGYADRFTLDVASTADLPRPTLVSYWPWPRFTRPRLSGSTRRPYLSPGLRVTLADGRTLLATAGHIDIDVGDPVYLTRDRWGIGQREPIGTMAWRSDPRRSDAGSTSDQSGRIDLALIELNRPSSTGRAIASADERAVVEGDLCEWTGASSGFSRGDVVGPLRTLEVDGVPLTHCWYLASDCRGGDSGSAVIELGQGAALGQVVGARGTRRRSGARPGTIVQHVGVLDEVVQREFGGQATLATD